MQYGICIPNFGIFSDVRLITEMAQDAEQAGWDGFFIWDHISFGLHKMPMVDPWIALTAIAIRTERLRIGPMVTPLPRRRPWKVAREATSLDHLSGGRVILGVGAGAGPYSWDNLGEVTDPKERSIMLDEALEVLVGLWSGEPLNYHGTHYNIHDTIYVPTPVQIPRIPIWVASVWPKKAPLRRAARWDGVFPSAGNWDTKMTPQAIQEMILYINEHRSNTASFDIVCSGSTGGDSREQDRTIIAPYAQAGVTWWLENIGSIEDSARARIRKGPPHM